MPSAASFKSELAEGVRWLMAHPLLRPMAIILGLMNAAGMISQATFVLFAQEVLDIGPVLFTVIGFGAAIGGLVGGNIAVADLEARRERHVPGDLDRRHWRSPDS